MLDFPALRQTLASTIGVKLIQDEVAPITSRRVYLIAGNRILNTSHPPRLRIGTFFYTTVGSSCACLVESYVCLNKVRTPKFFPLNVKTNYTNIL